MAQDSEKRFHSIMDKLFHAPKSVPNASASSSSSPNLQLSRGKKRPNPASALALLDPKSRDTDDEVQPSAGLSQSPICRPWDRSDLMRRLSTFKSMTWFAKPKAVSAVNCARRGWINVDMDIITCEACGARLLFSSPSSWSREQVEKAALVFSLKLDNGHKLLCPWIDNSCDESLVEFPPMPPNVLVEHFRDRCSLLVQLLALPVISSSAIGLMRSPQLDQFLKDSSLVDFGHASSDISLTMDIGNGCDAESASLYYQALKLISLCGWEPRVLPYMVDCKDRSDQISKDGNGSLEVSRENSVMCITSADSSEPTGGSGNSWNSCGALADPKSVVLDCKLCGASVGLWPFFTVTRPVELFHIVGLTAIDDERNSGSTSCGTHIDRILKVTPNAHSPKEISNLSLSIAGGPPPAQQNFKATISLPVIGRTIRARFSSDFDLRNYILINQKDNQCQPISRAVLQSKEGSDNIPRDTTDNCTSTQGASSHCIDSPLVEGSTQNDAQGLFQDNSMAEAGSAECNQELSSGNQASDLALAVHTVDVIEGETSSDGQNASAAEVVAEGDSGLGKIKENSAKNELLSSNAGKDPKLQPIGKGMAFDPIRQHRHFCPWIVSMSGGVPGWRQVLSALQRQKEVSHASPTSPPSSSLIKVDDPISSVRRLFTSKRMKSTPPS